MSISQPSTVGGSGPVPLAYYYPYSGRTPTQGVTGKLVDLGAYPSAVIGTSGTGYAPEFWLPARGGIALVRAAPSTYSTSSTTVALGGYEWARPLSRRSSTTSPPLRCRRTPALLTSR